MKKVLEFLTELKDNNNKAWFDAHKSQYLEAKSEFEAAVQQFIDGMVKVDPSVAGLTVKDCVYRIYRDVRFSNDKTPYKTHMGAFLCPHGRNSNYAGYYMHIEAHGSDYIGGHILAAGSYMPTPKQLESIRTEILDNSEEFMATISDAKGFVMENNSKLQRVPKGFPADFKYADMLKYKDYSIYKTLSDRDILAPDFIGRVVADLSLTVPFITTLNKAIDYANKEM